MATKDTHSRIEAAKENGLAPASSAASPPGEPGDDQRRHRRVMDDVRDREQRLLDDVYPVIFLDAIGAQDPRRRRRLAPRLRSRVGVTVAGERNVLGMWLQLTEGVEF